MLKKMMSLNNGDLEVVMSTTATDTGRDPDITEYENYRSTFELLYRNMEMRDSLEGLLVNLIEDMSERYMRYTRLHGIMWIKISYMTSLLGVMDRVFAPVSPALSERPRAAIQMRVLRALRTAFFAGTREHPFNMSFALYLCRMRELNGANYMIAGCLGLNVNASTPCLAVFTDPTDVADFMRMIE